MKCFLKKLLNHEIFRSMVSWAMKNFFENFVKLSDPYSYILDVRSLKPQHHFLCPVSKWQSPNHCEVSLRCNVLWDLILTVGNCVYMSWPGMITELLESVDQRHSSNLHVRSGESFQKRRTHLFSVISIVVMNGLNQILEYLIFDVTNFQWKDFWELLHA